MNAFLMVILTWALIGAFLLVQSPVEIKKEEPVWLNMVAIVIAMFVAPLALLAESFNRK